MSAATTLYYTVITIVVLTLCVLLYLLIINITSRRAAQDAVTSLVFITLGPCLWYLRLLHVTSWITVFALLLKHTKVLSSSFSCTVVNNVILASWILSRFFIGLIWESRHRAMTDVLHLKKSTARRMILLSAKLLVLAPLALLPLAIYYSTSMWDEGDKLCLSVTDQTVTTAELWTILGVSLIFFVLFLIKVAQASHLVSMFRSDICKLAKASKMSDFERTSKCVHQRARQTTVRNVLVVFFSLFWLVWYDAPLNRYQPSDSVGFDAFLYGSRLVIILDVLTTNIVLYFVFRNWSLFLCYPCRKQRSRHLLCESFSEDVQLPLLDEESPIMTQSLVQQH